MGYRNGEGLENGDGGVKNLAPATHERDGGSMFAELRRNFEADSRSSSGYESDLPLQNSCFERRFHKIPRF